MMFAVAKWYVGIGRKVITVVPFWAFCVVVLSCLSQVLLISAFLLPLKVLILLGSDGMPKFFPSAWAEIERERLVLWLTCIAISAYLLSKLTEILVGVFSEVGASKLLASSKKVPSVKKGVNRVKKDYKRYLISISSLVFAFSAVATVSCLYWNAFWASSLFVLVVFFPLVGMLMEILPDDKAAGLFKFFVEVLGALGFLGVFALMVADFLYMDPPAFLFAIISLLLLRQFFSKVSQVVVDSVALYVRRHEIEPLVFHQAKAKILATQKMQGTHNRYSEELIQRIFYEITGIDAAVYELQWQQIGVRGVHIFNFLSEISSENSKHRTRFLIKVFSGRKELQGEHEALLFNSGIKNLPAPGFLGSLVFEGDVFNLFQVQSCDLQKIGAGIRKRDLTWSVYAKLLGVRLPRSLVSMDGRSRPGLVERLENALTSRLNDVYPADAGLKKLKKSLSDIAFIINNTPLTIYNPDVNNDTVLLDREYLIVTHWGRWSLEPVGAGWPVSKAGFSKLEQAILEEQLINVDPSSAKLIAAVFQFESCCSADRYRDAMKLVPMILNALDVKSHTSKEEFN